MEEIICIFKISEHVWMGPKSLLNALVRCAWGWRGGGGGGGHFYKEITDLMNIKSGQKLVVSEQV